ncbi:MAG: preprotein translocase subunit YajC [Nocardioidaceae bacterium]|nr:preprotein translocase subunit YajC [Nocardioidaceae bacterium]
MNGLAGLLPFVLIAAVFWLLLIRPQRRRQQELASTQRGVEVGDEVLLGSGIVGRVAESEDDEFLRLEVDAGVHLKVARQAVVRVLQPEPDVDTAAEPGPEQDAGPVAGPVDPTERTRDH